MISIVKLCLPRNFSRKKNIKNWTVYVLRCADNTYYTGITNDVGKRLQAHNDGQGAKYTSGRIPVELVHREDNLTENQARKRECAIKSLKRVEKEKIIYGEVV